MDEELADDSQWRGTQRESSGSRTVPDVKWLCHGVRTVSVYVQICEFSKAESATERVGG